MTSINTATNLKAAQMIDVLRSHPGQMMPTKTIASELANRGIDVPTKTIANYLSVIAKRGDYPELTSKRGVGYVWNADEAEFYAKKAEKVNDPSAYRKKHTVMRNSEGYSDPTAGAAIRNTEGEDPYARLGEVWSVNGANGMTEWFLILSDWGTVRIGIPLYTGDFRSRLRVKVDLDGIVLYGDATNLRSKPRKYFDAYVGNVGEKKVKAILDDVLKAICDPDISPTVIEAVMPANTITVDGTLYTEADVKSKIDTVDILQAQNAAYDDDVTKLSEDLSAANAKIKELEDTNNGIRNALISAKKSKPVVIQVDGEIYNEEDIKAIIRARNTVRVGEKIYKASDIRELLDDRKSKDSAPVPDKAYIDKVVAMAAIYKQFFDAYCQGLAKGDIE